jgi:hypothetical protein
VDDRYEKRWLISSPGLKAWQLALPHMHVQHIALAPGFLKSGVKIPVNVATYVESLLVKYEVAHDLALIWLSASDF